ncbi:unnamed protein product [Darwinula stevensoni]|uniref:CARD domain-containing protein n=1 Tax=Darwinula stevensoni TaxID=69355 RepID=A0A7R9A5I5_9CRUS|nr:unnamed protein product [Darwinula stevensoni]CAG0886566.1 unnamed protein product [Darwinula stevensoni]
MLQREWATMGNGTPRIRLFIGFPALCLFMLSAADVLQAERNGPPENWDTIRQHRRRIRDDFNLDVDELLGFLSDKRVFTHNEEKIIRRVDDLSERFDKLFDILLVKNLDMIPLFYETLSAMGRNDIREFLQGSFEDKRSVVIDDGVESLNCRGNRGILQRLWILTICSLVSLELMAYV